MFCFVIACTRLPFATSSTSSLYPVIGRPPVNSTGFHSTNTLSDESIIHTNNSSNLIRTPNIQASFYDNFLLNYNKSAIHDSIPEASHDITSATNSSIENTQGIAASPIENTSIVISTLCKGEPSESYSGTPSIHLEDNSDNLNNIDNISLSLNFCKVGTGVVYA